MVAPGGAWWRLEAPGGAWWRLESQWWRLVLHGGAWWRNGGAMVAPAPFCIMVKCTIAKNLMHARLGATAHTTLKVNGCRASQPVSSFNQLSVNFQPFVSVPPNFQPAFNPSFSHRIPQ
jgi:hypothetical protein